MRVSKLNPVILTTLSGLCAFIPGLSGHTLLVSYLSFATCSADLMVLQVGQAEACFHLMGVV